MRWWWLFSFQKNSTYITTAKTKETNAAAINLIINFLFFIFFYRANESLSNCMDIIAIACDLVSAESRSDILVVSLLMLPLMMPSNYITFVLSLSTFSLALNIFTKSIILIRSFSFYLGSSQVFSICEAWLKKLEAMDMVEAYLASSMSWT